nr:MAG TPA: hypothetical protein [Caudoviricetes sp.]
MPNPPTSADLKKPPHRAASQKTLTRTFVFDRRRPHGP